ncbi:hypothetical protein [Streptomyces venezuelae]|uniref:hypothetical protein n=1 Tax=Streptomyces venezuelae TaxID=54571 RepID=UPI00168D8C90|nr:hypothetical protein [Streptomyces venezuelae]
MTVWQSVRRQIGRFQRWTRAASTHTHCSWASSHRWTVRSSPAPHASHHTRHTG